MHRLYIFLFLSALMLASCEEEIAFKGTETVPRLVVNCLISPDSIIIAQVKKSNSIQKPVKDNNIVTDAVVRFYENSQFLGFLTLNNEEIELSTSYKVAEIYGLAGLSLTAGNLYRLEVEAPGFESVSAQVTMPEPVEIIRVDTSFVTTRDAADRDINAINFAVTFNDPSAEENYYRLVVRETVGRINGYGYGGEGDTYYRIRVEQGISLLGSNDVVINPDGNHNEDSFMSSATNRHMVFSDVLFNGKEATVTVYIKSYGFANLNLKEFNFFEIELHSISKEYYLYEQSLRQFEHKQDNPFAEPVQVFSNIENGYGIFAAYSVKDYGFMEGVYPDDSDEYSVEYFFID